MNDHLPAPTKMISDTPISDRTPHNVADLGMLCRELERELNAANLEIERLTNKVAQLYEGAEEATQRIKRLEDAGDALYENSNPLRWDSPTDGSIKLTDQSNWNKAKL